VRGPHVLPPPHSSTLETANSFGTDSILVCFNASVRSVVHAFKSRRGPAQVHLIGRVRHLNGEQELRHATLEEIREDG
jgi:hypothetical protein